MGREIRVVAPIHAKRQYPAKRLQAETKTALRFYVVECDCNDRAVDLTGLTIALWVWRDQLDDDSLALIAGKAGTIIGPAEDGLCEVVIDADELPYVESVFARLDLLDAGTRVASTPFVFRVQGVN